MNVTPLDIANKSRDVKTIAKVMDEKMCMLHITKSQLQEVEEIQRLLTILTDEVDVLCGKAERLAYGEDVSE